MPQNDPCSSRKENAVIETVCGGLGLGREHGSFSADSVIWSKTSSKAKIAAFQRPECRFDAYAKIRSRAAEHSITCVDVPWADLKAWRLFATSSVYNWLSRQRL